MENSASPVSAQVGKEHGPIVTIIVNNIEREIHRGSQTVSHIKTVGQVPQADVLSQVINNKPEDLPDDGRVTIKGGEIFVSHPRSGGSSYGRSS